MDAQTNPSTEPAVAKKNRYETLDEKIMKMQITFGNATLPIVFEVMKTVGYTEEKIASMKAKLETLVNLQQIRTKKYAEQLAETEKFDHMLLDIDALFNMHRSLMHILLKGDHMHSNMLRLNSPVPTAYPAWDKMVKNFYDQIVTTRELMTIVQTVGITPEVITAQQTALVNLFDLKESQRKEISEAIDATEARDHAFDELYPLYTEYANYAKVLLTDNQALKALGLKAK